jgi:hypothetical protein
LAFTTGVEVATVLVLAFAFAFALTVLLLLAALSHPTSNTAIAAINIIPSILRLILQKTSLH